MSAELFRTPGRRRALLSMHGTIIGCASFFDMGSTQDVVEAAAWVNEARAKSIERIGFDPDAVESIGNEQALAILRDCKVQMEAIVQVAEIRLAPPGG